MVDKHITESIAYPIGNRITGTFTNTGSSYDVAVDGKPFLLAIADDRPYRRQTAKYRKDQFDQSPEAGEQSLTGWWLRSQASFHNGAGIKYFEPVQDETLRYQFADSKGVNVWTQGQATLLREVNQGHQTTGNIASNGVTQQYLRAIEWTTDSITYQGALMLDELDIDKIFPKITASVTNKALTSNVATLTTAAAHGFCTGMMVVVSGVDATFNGEYKITGVPTTTTFTYAKTAADVVSTAVSPAGSASCEVIHLVDYVGGVDSPAYAMCDDGENAFWITNTSTKKTVYKQSLNTDSGTSPTMMFDEIGTISNAVMEYVKNRIVMAADNKIYEFASNAVAMPTAVYTNPSSGHVYTSITASGPAIYVAGYNKLQSTIEKFILSTAGAMPTLTSAITAAEMPIGEVVHAIHYYLGYMLIGTNKGIRVAQVVEDGSLLYGPLIVETEQPVYAFTTRDRFAWATTNVDGEPGLIRIDLSQQLSPLRFAYANDVYKSGVTGKVTTAVSFIGTTDRLAFATAAGYSYIEDDDTLLSSGYITTGRIRYNTLEPKVYKLLWPRADVSNGTLNIYSIDTTDTEFLIRTIGEDGDVTEGGVNYPNGSYEYISLKFVLGRGTDTTKSSILSGYQLKALPATKRQRLIQFPVLNFDFETDAYGNKIGYEGRSYDRIKELEGIEERGDTVLVQDFRTNETFTAQLEELDYINMTPPTESGNNFGGVLLITVRTV